MKLRAYTPQETDELLYKFIVIAKYVQEINECAYKIMSGRYADYIQNFSWSIFQWTPIEFEEFTNKLSYWNKPNFKRYYIDERFDGNSLFKNNLFKVEMQIFHGSSWSQYYDDFMVKKGCQNLSEEEFNILYESADCVNDFVFDYNLHKKYTALVKYAHKPFEFDETDIPWLEKIDNFYKKALEWNLNSQKDNVTKS